jgi:hypothetical protein
MSTLTHASRGSRHPVNIGHLVMGLAFAGLLGIWALIVGDVVDDDDIRWLLPLPWVFAGAVGLLAVTLATRRRMAGPTFAEPHEATATNENTDNTTETTDTEEIR